MAFSGRGKRLGKAQADKKVGATGDHDGRSYDSALPFVFDGTLHDANEMARGGSMRQLE
jgi:hypothetical protein